MRNIYASIRMTLPGINVRDVSELSPVMRKWVTETMRRLTASPTLPERKAAEILRRFDDRPVRQAFFMIRGRCYFLDFFLPERLLAIEIDGSSHKERKEKDRRRDADFRSIGIRTIRIKNKDVMNGKLVEKIARRIYK